MKVYIRVVIHVKGASWLVKHDKGFSSMCTYI